MAGGSISYRIVLDSTEAQQAFAGLQRSGEGAFRSLESAAASLTRGGGFAALAATITTAVGAFVGLTSALFGMANSSSKAVDELGELAAQTGSTVEEISTLRSALLQFEADADKLQSALNRMGNTIQQQFTAAQKNIREFAVQAQKDMLAVEAAAQRLFEARWNLALAQAGPGAKRDPIDEEEFQIQKAMLAVEQARQAQIQAITAQREHEINSVARLKQFIDALASGASTAGIQVNASVENMIRGLIASVGPGVQALSGVTNSLGQIGQQAPALRPVLLRLADVFKNMTDETLKMAIATRLFGRAAATGMVEALSQGSAAIIAQENRMKSLGLVITQADEAISKGFIQALGRLRNALGIVGTQLGLLFQPAFTQMLNTIANAVEQGRGRILAFGAAIRDAVLPVLETFVRVLLGIPQAGTDDWLLRYIANIRAFGEAVSSVITGVVIPAFRLLLAVAGAIASGLNSVFGTNLNALEILIAAWVAKILGLFRLVALGVGAMGSAIAAIATQVAAATGSTFGAALLATVATLIRQFIILTAVITAAVEAWNNFVTPAGGGELGKFDNFLERTTQKMKALGATEDEIRAKTAALQQEFAKTGQVPSEAATGFFDKISQQIDQLDAKLKGLQGQSQATGAQLAQAGAQAAGGLAQAAQQADRLGAAAQQAGAASQQATQQVAQGAGQIAAPFNQAAQGAKQIVAPFQTAPQVVQPFVGKIQELDQAVGGLGVKITQLPNFTTVFTGLPEAATILQAVETSVQGVQQAAASIQVPAELAQPFVDMGGAIQRDVEAIEQFVSALPRLGDTSAVNAQGAAMQALVPIIGHLISQYNALAEAARAASAALFSSPESGGGLSDIPGGARGGLIWGPGTGTSDSIFARLSRGEYVIRSKAVEHFGANFFAALNALKLPKFSLGGLANLSAMQPIPIPAFAGGGGVTMTGRPLTVVLGGQRFPNLIGPVAVVDNLERHAVLLRAKSLGKAPSWVT